MNRKFSLSFNRHFTVFALVVSFVGGSLTSRKAEAQEPIREFVLASSYGVLAGTLVGAATLAFSDRPGDNLNKVARGASIGLYCGILLGFYIVYGVPSEEDEEMPVVWNLDGTKTPSAALTQISYRVPKEMNQQLLVMPVIGDRGIEGAQASMQVLSF